MVTGMSLIGDDRVLQESPFAGGTQDEFDLSRSQSVEETGLQFPYSRDHRRGNHGLCTFEKSLGRCVRPILAKSAHASQEDTATWAAGKLPNSGRSRCLSAYDLMQRRRVTRLTVLHLLVADRSVVKRTVEELPQGTDKFHLANEIFRLQQALQQQIIPEHLFCSLESKHELAERHALPGPPNSYTFLCFFDLRERLGEQPVAEV